MSMHGCMRTCNKFSWGDVGPQKCHISIHLSLHYSLHFIIPLTFHHTIFINTFGFHIIIFHFTHFSILSEFVIKSYKLTYFHYISRLDEFYDVYRYIWRFQQSQILPPSLKFEFHLQALKIWRIFGTIIQAYSKEKIMDILMAYLI